MWCQCNDIFLDTNPQNIPHSTSSRGSYGISILWEKLLYWNENRLCYFWIIFVDFQTVQICHNPQLGYIAPNAFEAAAQILELYLNHNALRTLAEGLVTWSSIKQLDLSGNLWRCDCRIKWMGEVLHLSGLASQDLTWVISAPWWRHQMETFSALLVLCAGNSPSPMNSPRKGQCRRALLFSLICAWTNGWVNNRGAGDLRRHCAHYDVITMPAWITNYMHSTASPLKFAEWINNFIRTLLGIWLLLSMLGS